MPKVNIGKSDFETSASAGAHVVRETQEVKGLRAFVPFTVAMPFRPTSESQNAGLLHRQFQTELGQPFAAFPSLNKRRADGYKLEGGHH